MAKFQDRLHKFDITCELIREKWKHIVLIDKDVSTELFTMDLTEPHVALTQSPYSIDLESIVENIMEGRFRVLRPIDKFMRDRIDRMVHPLYKSLAPEM
ncbi:unnamed protein product [Adineta ricciae]|uniref:Uncharacterized protein n=1 Tax=Adineta ricciae TaxID=249248 RepID=A0A815TA92_ADIRI|nr:unnamed protein product [Adineta ricciae]CAF1521361.1 unnamed protein product [Adineta ricciae]